MRGATTKLNLGGNRNGISIHAPHARSDACVHFAIRASQDFNPRSSCEERLLPVLLVLSTDYFNPRSSCEERRRVAGVECSNHNFNPRSSCEERRADREDKAQVSAISIHAPHARSDLPGKLLEGADLAISIHAPHARSDCVNFRH